MKRTACIIIPQGTMLHQRFISRDVLFEIDPSFSSYTYCANNPINYIDPTGNYRYDYNKLSKRSKRLADFLNNDMINYVMNNPTILSALKTYGQFKSDAEIKEVLTNGLGPKISIVDRYNEMGYPAPSRYEPSNNTIYIASDIIEILNNATGEDREAALFLVISLLLHETVHFGDWQHGDSYDNEACRYDENGIYKDQKNGSDYGHLFQTEVYFNKRWGQYIETFIQAKKALQEIKMAGEKEILPSFVGPKDEDNACQ
jgi:hypothetical protein